MAEQRAETTSRLRFDKILLNSRIAGYFTNPRLLLLIVSMIMLLGIYSFIKIPRVLNPSINIAIVNVVTVLPGAGPDDVESLVTIPIEDAVTGVEKVKKVNSSSTDSLSLVSLEFESGVDPEKARGDVQSAVDTVNGLPTDAVTPKVQKLDFQNTPIWAFTVTTKDDPASLSRFSKDLKKRIENLASVKQVSTTGIEEQEIQVVLKPEAISDYGLNPQQLTGLIKSSTSSFPAGGIKTSTSNFSLTIDPQVVNINDLRNVKLTVGQKVVSLSDVAVIVERSKPDQNNSFFASKNENVQKSINFNVYKTSSAQIEVTAKEAEQLADEVLKEYNGRFTINSDQDSAEFIQDQFTELLRDFWITISLVFLTLFIFLGLRQAIVASLAIPLTFFVTFTIMNMTGIQFSFIAFFSLLLSLGLLVDDTIVVVSAMTQYYRTGQFTPLETGLLVWRDFLIAIFTTTLTTVWAFVPLLLASGIIGEFIKPIPIVVSTSLLGSFFVAMFVTMPFTIFVLRPNTPPRVVILLRVLFLVVAVVIFYSIIPKNNLLLLQILLFLVLLFVFVNTRKLLFGKIVTSLRGVVTTKQSLTMDSRLRGNDKSTLQSRFRKMIDDGMISFEPIHRSYQRTISRILDSSSARKKTIAAVVMFFIFSVLLFPLGLVKNEFFPPSDEDYLYVSLEMPAGTNLETTEKETIKVLDQLRFTEGLKFANANLGTGLDVSSGGFSQGTGNQALISLVLEKKENRHKTSVDLAQEIRDKFKDYNIGKLNVQEVSGGPPAGSDLQIKLHGPDLNVLDQYANKIQDYLKTQQGVTNIDKSVKSGTSKITFVPDQAKLAQSGLTVDSLGFWLRTYASGFEADKIKLPGETTDEDITIRTNSDSQVVESVGKIFVPTTTGGNVPLLSLGELQLKPNPTLITREDGNRTISVSAGVEKGFVVTDKNKDLENFANSLNLPSGYGWSTGGVNEENQNSVNSILQAMLLSFLLIIITMVIQFSSFRDAMIVMLVIPLAASGVFILFALTHTPLSFPALIGVLALFGIVVKNSILVVDKINQNKKAGLSLKDAIADASASRIEAIALTSFATIAGLIPITLSDPLWRGLGGAIIAGLTFSGTIMLFFIPVMYYVFFSRSEK